MSPCTVSDCSSDCNTALLTFGRPFTCVPFVCHLFPCLKPLVRSRLWLKVNLNKRPNLQRKCKLRFLLSSWSRLFNVLEIHHVFLKSYIKCFHPSVSELSVGGLGWHMCHIVHLEFTPTQ